MRIFLLTSYLPALQCDYYSARAHCTINTEMIYCVALSYTQFPDHKCITTLWDMHPNIKQQPRLTWTDMEFH